MHMQQPSLLFRTEWTKRSQWKSIFLIPPEKVVTFAAGSRSTRNKYGSFPTCCQSIFPSYACSLGPRMPASIGFPGDLTFAVMNACILAMCSSFRWLNRSWFFKYSLTGLYAFGMC